LHAAPSIQIPRPTLRITNLHPTPRSALPPPSRRLVAVASAMPNRSRCKGATHQSRKHVASQPIYPRLHAFARKDRTLGKTCSQILKAENAATFARRNRKSNTDTPQKFSSIKKSDKFPRPQGNDTMSHWVLANQTLALDLETNDATGAMTGTLNYLGVAYQVSGGWDASYSLPGRNYSAFGLSGNDGATAPRWIAATGIMNGPGGAPADINIQMDIASSTDGTMTHYEGVVLPS
jgi:hypothetical protein